MTRARLRLPPILTFHELEDGRSPDCYPPDRFARAMARLHAEGFQALPLLDLVDGLRRGVPLPERAFVLTFDDGYRSVYRRGAPILARYGWTATVFLVTGPRRRGAGASRLPDVSGRSTLSWREVEELRDLGFSFGAHGLTHVDLTRLPPDRAEAEIAGSRSILEDALGTPITTFAYPFGRHDPIVREIARRHFTCACTDRLGLLDERSDLHALERIDAHYLRSEALWRTLPNRWFRLYVRARSTPRELRRAVAGVGR